MVVVGVVKKCKKGRGTICLWNYIHDTGTIVNKTFYGLFITTLDGQEWVDFITVTYGWNLICNIETSGGIELKSNRDNGRYEKNRGFFFGGYH